MVHSDLLSQIKQDLIPSLLQNHARWRLARLVLLEVWFIPHSSSEPNVPSEALQQTKFVIRRVILAFRVHSE